MSNFHIPNFANKKLFINIEKSMMQPQDYTFKSNIDLNSAINPVAQHRSPLPIQ